jgi:porphobilinogen synthase
MSFPKARLRRLRQTENVRQLVKETKLSVDDLVMPYFVVEGKGKKNPIAQMPGIYQLSIDSLLKEIKGVHGLGIPAVLLFGVPANKDNKGSEAYKKTGVVEKAVRAIKKEIPAIVVITDVCLCGYTSSGHCWVGDNDNTLKLLAKIAVSQAKAGADMLAPSAMMDGQVKAIRDALDKNGYKNAPILAYSAKYASNFYGPFREAAESAPKFGDRKSYQMGFANVAEALREIELDISEGADMVMVKPALAYLDVIRKVKDRFNIPVAAYNVSGEYSMIKAAAREGWLEEKEIILEILTSIKRAGADIIITYHAKEVAKFLND